MINRKIEMEKDVLGIITARGGSKGVTRKNIRQVAGKSLISWTIEAGKKSSKIKRLIVSTEDKEIAQACRDRGVEVPFLRPNELAMDDSPHIDVLVHAIEWLMKKENYYPDYVLLLQPTSPLRTADDIDAAITLSIEQNADSVISVSEAQTHPYLLKKVNKDGVLIDFVKRPKGYLPRQSFSSVYAVNGAIFLARRDVILQRRDWYTERTYSYHMPIERSLDIDTPWDMYLADLILRNKNYVS